MTERKFAINGVLASIPPRACQRLQAQLEPVTKETEAPRPRWLPMTRDRVGSDEFPLTHEFLAHRLGSRRAGVTEAASALKRPKLISHSRGKMQMLDVRGLKASSCSCHQIVKSVFNRAQG
jgi:CRP-like cAMP-binding protein